MINHNLTQTVGLYVLLLSIAVLVWDIFVEYRAPKKRRKQARLNDEAIFAVAEEARSDFS